MTGNLTESSGAKRPTLFFVMTTLLVVALLGCGDSGVADPAPSSKDASGEGWRDLSKEPFDPSRVGGTLVVGMRSAPPTLNNLLWSDDITRTYLKQYLCPTLLIETPDAGPSGFKAVPNAARSLPQVQADGRTYVWRLRDDLIWSDGVPVTAKDYAFTWQLLKNPEIRCDKRRGTLSNVEELKALGDHEFEVRFKDVYYNAAPMFGLEFSVVPAHAVPTTAAAFNELDRHVGFGPYEVIDSTKQRLLLSLRAEYREQPYPLWPWYVENLEFRFVPDAGNRLEQLRTGKIDVAVIPSGRFAAMQEDAAFLERNQAVAYPLPNYEFIAWNTRNPSNLEEPHPLFGTAAVRRALTRVVDRDHIVETVRNGLAKKVNGPYWYRDADYDDSVPELPFDPEQARALLEKEGWKLNDSGVLEKDGRPFRFKLMIIGSPLWRAPALVVQDGAKKAGIDIQFDVVTTTKDLLRRLEEHDFDAFLIRNGLKPPIEPDQFELFHSSLARVNGSNWAALENPAVDKLLETTRRTLDPAKRLQMRRQFHRLFDAVHPFTVICCTFSSVGVSRRWSNVKVHDLGLWYRDFQLRR